MESRHFSKPFPLIRVMAIAAIVTTSGCATVRPEERGKLANPSMTFGSDGLVQAHEDHVFVNREGSYGGGTVTGGGCGCN